MALVGVSVGEVQRFNLAGDTESPTVFLLGVLSSRVEARIKDGSTGLVADDDGGYVPELKMNQMTYDLVRYALRGWENFQDAKGNDIEFGTVKANVGGKMIDVVSHESMDLLDLEWIREIAEKVQEINAVTETEAKSDPEGDAGVDTAA